MHDNICDRLQTNANTNGNTTVLHKNGKASGLFGISRLIFNDIVRAKDNHMSTKLVNLLSITIKIYVDYTRNTKINTISRQIV